MKALQRMRARWRHGLLVGFIMAVVLLVGLMSTTQTASAQQQDVLVQKVCYTPDQTFWDIGFVSGAIPTVVYAGEQWLCTVFIGNDTGVDIEDAVLLEDILEIPQTDLTGEVFLQSVVVNDDIGPISAADAHAEPPGASCVQQLDAGSTDSFYPFIMTRGPVECTLDLPADSSVYVTFSFTVSPFYLTLPFDAYDEKVDEAPICSQSTVSYDTPNVVASDALDEVASDCDIVKGKADLRITKIANGDTVPAGEPLKYWILVENFGPSAASKVAIIDDIYAFLDEDLLGIPGVDGPEFLAGPFAECGFITELDLGGCLLGRPLEPVGSLPLSGRWWVYVESPQGTLEPTTITNKVDVFTVRNSLTISEVEELDGLVMQGTFDPDMSNNTATTVQVVTAVSDLGIEVEDLYPDGSEPPGDDYFNAGEFMTYGITVTNLGPSTAVNVVVQDALPAEVTLVEIWELPGSEDCDVRESFGNTVVTCNIGTLDPFEYEDFFITVRVHPDVQMPAVPDAVTAAQADDFVWVPWALINTACVTSDNFDDDNSDNCEEEDTYITAYSDLDLEKNVSPGDRAIYAGEVINYNIYVWNEGPSTAHNVIVKDDFDGPIDEYVDLVSYNIADGPGECYFEDFGRKSLVCTIGKLEPGQGRRIDFVIQTDPSTPPGTFIENDAYAFNTTGPADEPDDYASVEVQTMANLRATKRSSELSPATGDVFFYTVEITNDGPSTAEDVEVYDELTGSLEYLYSRDVACMTNGVDVDCYPGDILPGETVRFDIVVQVKPNVRDGHCSDNMVSITGDTQPFTIQAPLEAFSEEICFRNTHDLRIRKFGKPDGQAAAGEALVYTVIVDNFGPGRAWNIEVSDLLASDGDYTFTAPSFCSPSSGSGSGNTQLVCRIDPTTPNKNYLDPDGQWIFNVTVTANHAQSINNVADVNADGTDLDNSNNSAIVEHGVDAAVNLEVLKSVDRSSVDAGGQLDYTIVVRNLGPSIATDVQVRDTLPPWVTLESMTTNRGVCVPAEVECVISTLDVNQAATIHVVVNVATDAPAGAYLDNTVRVSSDEYDVQASNNVATARSRVARDEDIRIVKEASAETVGAGERLDYRITVENVGTSPVDNVVVKDDLPDNVDFVSYQMTGGAGTCVDSLFNPELICELGTLAQGETRVIFVRVQVKPDAPEEPIINTVIADDPRFSSDSEYEAMTYVVRSAHMRTEFSTSVISVALNEVFSYKVKVINEGVGTLDDVRVNVTLPDLLAYVTDTIGCGPGLQQCALGDIPPGESREFELLVRLTGFAPNGSLITSSVATSTSSGNVNSTGNLIATVVVNTTDIGSEAIFLPLINP